MSPSSNHVRCEECEHYDVECSLPCPTCGIDHPAELPQ